MTVPPVPAKKSKIIYSVYIVVNDYTNMCLHSQQLRSNMVSVKSTTKLPSFHRSQPLGGQCVGEVYDDTVSLQ